MFDVSLRQFQVPIPRFNFSPICYRSETFAPLYIVSHQWKILMASNFYPTLVSFAAAAATNDVCSLATTTYKPEARGRSYLFDSQSSLLL